MKPSKYIIQRGVLNLKLLRYHAVHLSYSKEDGTVNLPLAQAIENYVLTGHWNSGQGYDKKHLDDVIGEENNSVR